MIRGFVVFTCASTDIYIDDQNLGDGSALPHKILCQESSGSTPVDPLVPPGGLSGSQPLTKIRKKNSPMPLAHLAQTHGLPSVYLPLRAGDLIL